MNYTKPLVWDELKCVDYVARFGIFFEYTYLSSVRIATICVKVFRQFLRRKLSVFVKQSTSSESLHET